MHIEINPHYQSKKEAILLLTEHFTTDGAVIVEGARNTLKSNVLGDEKVTIKYFQKPGALKRLIYSYFRSSKAKRSFDYAVYLLEHDIPTPTPIAYVEERNSWGWLGESYYICLHIDYDFTIRELIHDPLFPERIDILKQFTAFTYKMHEAQVNFLDHSPGNTLIVKKGAGVYDFYLIDLNRMQFQPMPIETRMDNFKKMWLSKAMVKVIASEYARLAHQDENKLQTLLLKKTMEFKRTITKKKYWKRVVKRK